MPSSESEAGWFTMNDENTTFREMVGYHCNMKWRADGTGDRISDGGPFSHPENILPLPNLWLGVTAENQARAEERIPILLQTPAAKRFVSIEPMLGQVDLWRKELQPGVDWVIAGGENAPDGRPTHPDWIRAINNYCVLNDVPFLFKGWGTWVPRDQLPVSLVMDPESRLTWRSIVGHGTVTKGVKMHTLNGIIHHSFPEE